MNEFPWGVSTIIFFGLLGTLWFIVYVLRLDTIEEDI